MPINRNWKAALAGSCFVAALTFLASLTGASYSYADAETSGGQLTTASVSSQSNDAQRATYLHLTAGKRMADEKAYPEPGKPTVYLTFDDGPSGLTEHVLDVLQNEGVKATFFVLGEQAKSRPDTIRRMAEEGHAIGNHSYNHIYKDLYGSYQAFREQIERTDAILQEIIGYKPVLMRAPGGTYTNFDAFYFYYLEQAGYSVFDWNVDSGDSVRQGVPVKEIIETIKRSPLKKQLIVLMHDGTGHEESLRALEEVIRYYKSEGYEFAPLDPDVRPVQFPLGKLKWKRVNSFADFSGNTGLAEAAGKERSILLTQYREREERFKLQTTAAREESSAAFELKRKIEPKLTVMLRGTPWELEDGRYDFHYGRFAVPLRDLVQRLGGKVEWNERSRTATVRLGTKVVIYDPDRGLITDCTPGQTEYVRHLADVRLVDGEIRIPLRTTAKVLGSFVGSYELEKWAFRV